MIIYSGNKRISGGLLRTNYTIEKNKAGRSEISFFFSIQQQTGYDEKNNHATFKDGKSKTVKFNQTEIGAIITTFLSSISNGKIQKWTSFHDGKEKTSILFSYYHVEAKDPKKGSDTNMFTLNYKVGDEKYSVGISIGDMYALKTKIDTALHEFNLIESDEENKERAKFANAANNDDNDDNDDIEDDNNNSSNNDEDDDVPF